MNATSHRWALSALIFAGLTGCAGNKPLAIVDSPAAFVETSPELAVAREKANGAPAKNVGTMTSRMPLIGSTKRMDTWLLPNGDKTQVINVHSRKKGKQWAITGYDLQENETRYK